MKKLAGYAANKLVQKYHIAKTPTLLYVDAVGTVLDEGNEAFAILS